MLIWLRLLWPTLLGLGLAGLAYWIVGPNWALGILAITLAVVGCFHALQLQQLYIWAATPRSTPLPEGQGPWRLTLERLRRFVRQEAQQRVELSAELQRVHSAVDYVPDSLVVLDADNHVQWSNKAAESLHGIFGRRRPVQQFMRQPEFVEYLEKADYGDALRLSLSQRPNQSFELRIHVTPEGQKLMITRDTTDHTKVDLMRRDFIANVSHEIRTPVTVIGGFAETLLTLPLDVEARTSYLNTILKQSQTMQRLVDDLLMLSSLESSNPGPLEEEAVSVPGMLQALALEARAISAGRHRVELDLQSEHGLLASSSQLESAIRNLITNAIRYTPEGGAITIRWQTTTAEAIVSVQDSGIGIASEHIPRLTERFYRVDRGRSRDDGGTGLGLAIVKHILQRHEANLRVSSKLGSGSVFSLVFPAKRMVQAEQFELLDNSID